MLSRLPVALRENSTGAIVYPGMVVPTGATSHVVVEEIRDFPLRVWLRVTAFEKNVGAHAYWISVPVRWRLKAPWREAVVAFRA